MKESGSPSSTSPAPTQREFNQLVININSFRGGIFWGYDIYLSVKIL